MGSFLLGCMAAICFANFGFQLAKFDPDNYKKDTLIELGAWAAGGILALVL